MSADLLLRQFERIGNVPDGIARLRRFVLDLAVSGRIVEQDPSEHPVNINGGPSSLRSGTRRQRSSPLLSYPNLNVLELPSGWKMATVGQIAECLDYMREPVNIEVRNERTLGKSHDELFPYYGATQQQGWIDAFLFDEALVLLGEDGVPFLDRLRSKAYLISGRTWVNNHAHVLRSHLALPEFLVLALNTFDYQGRVMGATRSKLNQGQMVTMPIPIPPLAEQHRIVAKVGELMTLCDQLEAVQKERELQRDALRSVSLHRLTSTDDVANGASNVQFFLKTSPRLITKPEHVAAVRQTVLDLAVRGRLVPQDPADVPAEYDPRPVRGVATLQNGYAFKSEWFQASGLRLLRNVNVAHGTIDWAATACVDEARASEFARFSLNKGDIVLSLDRPFITTGTKVAVVMEHDLPALLLQRVGRFQMDPTQLDPSYLFLWVTSPSFSRQIDPGRSNGVPHISSRQVEDAEIVVPPLAEQHRIVAKVDEVMAVCDDLEAALASAQDGRGRLLEALLHETLNLGETSVHLERVDVLPEARD